MVTIKCTEFLIIGYFCTYGIKLITRFVNFLFLYADTYSLPEGVFLFIGYSEREESLMQELSNLTVADVAATLQDHMRAKDMERPVGGEVLCTLLLHNVTRENLILVAKLVHSNVTEDLSPADVLRKEKVRATIHSISMESPSSEEYIKSAN